MIELGGKIYQPTIGSDLDRDGFYLEVEDSDRALVAEVFYSDQDGSMSFTGYRPAISLELVEWMLAEAKARLTLSGGKSG